MQLVLRQRLGVARPGSNGFGRLAIARGMALGVVVGARRFSQHVEREAIAERGLLLAIDERVIDRRAEHELAAENAHRLAQCLANQRLAAPRDQPLHEAAEIAVLALAPIDDVPSQHQPPGRGIHQDGVRMAEMARPVASADRAGDQPVGGRGVGDAEQRLREAEQQHPLLARKAIFVQQRIDSSLFAPSVTRRLDEIARQKLDPGALRVAAPRLFDQRLDRRGLVGKERSADRFASGQCGKADVTSWRSHDASLTLCRQWFEVG